MSYTNFIQKITDTDGTTHDLLDSSASHFIRGTQTASTNVWTGPLPDGVTDYYDGLMIDYWLPFAGTSTAATLNLGGKGAKPVYRGNAATSGVTTHIAAKTVAHLTYVVDSGINSGNGAWIMSSYYDSDSNTVDRLRDSYFRPYAGEAVYRYKFVMQGADNRMYPITVTNQENTTQVAKMPTQVGLRPGRIWFYNTTTTVAAGGLFAANTLDEAYQTTAGVYNFNTDAPTYRMIYLRGTYNKTTDLFTLYKDNSSPCTSYYTYVPTNTANITLSSYFTSGYYYILLGGTYSTANYISLFPYNPLYYFDGTNLIPASTKVAQDSVPTKTSTTPKMDGTAAVGSETTYAAGDHVHPSDTSRVPTTRKVNGKALSSDVTLTGEDINVGSSSGDSVSIYQTFANLEESLADTFDTIAIDLDDKVDKVDGKGLSTNDYTTTEKNKLSGIASGAEVNQNAFSNVKVKPTASASTTTTIAADAKTDTLSLEAGNYIELTADATNDKITVGAVLPMASSSPAVAGLMSSTDKGKLDGITSGAEVNQNAFSNVKVGSTTIAADSKTDTLELVAGTGVTLTPDATNDKVTISATSSGGGLVNLQDGTGTGSIEMSSASAVKSYQTALGKYNKEDTGTDKDLSNFALIIGDGSSSSARSNLFTINNSGLITTHPFSSDYNWKTSSAAPNETQYFTGFEIRDRDEVRLSHIDTHIDTTGKVGTVLGAERKVGNDIIRNQIYLYVDASGAKSYIIDAPAAFRSALDIYDHVFEQGTSGIWTYRKWSSGIAECWAITSSTNYAVTSSYVNGYYTNLGTVSFPSGLFIAAPSIQGTRTNTGSGSALIFLSLHTVTASSFAGYVCATSSGTYGCQFSYHAIGRWKS